MSEQRQRERGADPTGAWGEEATTAENLNSALRFLLELSVLAAVIHGSLTIIGGDLGWFGAVGGALLASFVWVNFVNPRGVMTPGDPWRLILEIAIFGAAVVLLFGAGREILGAPLRPARRRTPDRDLRARPAPGRTESRR